MDDAPLDRGNATGGELPDGVYGENTRWEFCCRSDGSSITPIELPNEEPFILFPIDDCQEVEGKVLFQKIVLVFSYYYNFQVIFFQIYQNFISEMQFNFIRILQV